MKTTVFRRCEIGLHSTKNYENPFLDVEIEAVFTHEDGGVISLPGFWNGGNEWKVRFTAERPGQWRYRITCSDQDNVSLTAEGTLDAEECEPGTELERHGPVTIPEGSRYFAYADGTPFFWLGDTHWQMPDYERLNECNVPGCPCGSQFRHLADDRAKKGFTVYQTYFDSAESDGGGNPRPHHWWQEKYTLINPQAFNETMDVMMEELASRGITVAMGFGVHTNTIAAMKSDPKPIQAFARYCVARYACYPVVWITAQEITDARYDAFSVWQSVAELVSRIDGYHRPNSAHMYPMGSQDERAQTMDRSGWHRYWLLQAGHGGVNALQKRSFYESYRTLASGKPYIEGECQYEDIYCGGFCGYDASRIGAWQALLSGAAGFTYGVTGIWAMGWNQRDDCGWQSYSPEPWYVGMDKPGSTEMTYLRRFFAYVDHTSLEPAFGCELGEFVHRDSVSAAHRGQDVLVYQFFGTEPETGVLAGLKPKVRYQARWFDPIGGGFIDLPDMLTETGSAPVPPRPSERDWILLLNCAALGDYERESYPAAKKPLTRDEAHPGRPIPFASFTASSEEEEHPASNLPDGRDETVWKPFAPRTSVTFRMDLGAVRHADYLSLRCPLPESRSLNYRIETSADGERWCIVAERVNHALSLGGGHPEVFEDIAGTFRYLRLFLFPQDSAEKWELSGISVWEKEKAEPSL